MAPTYYDRLGVDEDASTEAIKRAYRERLKETHPDVSDAADASDRTKRLIEAKEVLADEDERARYDRLGHEQYVVTADMPGHSGEKSESAETGHSTASSGTANTEQSRTGTSETGRSSTTASTGTTGSRTSSSTAATSGWTDASETTWGTGPEDDVGTSASTHKNQRAPRDSWRDTERKKRTSSDSPDAGNTAWRAWDTEGAYSVTEGGYSGPSLATGESLVLLCTTFLFYPLMLAGALFPPFPLLVNVTLGACVLGIVAYLQSIPTVGVIVFGTWSVLAPAILLSAGIGLITAVGLATLAGTVFPLGLSLLTRAVIRP